MKNIRILLVIAGLIILNGCQKEKDTPEPTSTTTPTPTTPNYTKFKINEVIVGNMPFNNSNGFEWDTSSDPDIFFLIGSPSGTLLFDGSSAYKTNISSSNLPTGWSFSSPYIVYPLSESFYIHLYDNDVNDFPSNADDYIGSVLFTMSNYTSSYPTTVSNNFNGLYITLNGTWAN